MWTGSSEEALCRTRAVSVPFIENKGQLDDEKIRYYADTFAGRMTVSEDGGISYHLRSDNKESTSLPVVTERPAGAGPKQIAAGRRAVTPFEPFLSPGTNYRL